MEEHSELEKKLLQWLRHPVIGYILIWTWCLGFIWFMLATGNRDFLEKLVNF